MTTIEEKLRALHDLQKIDSQIDEIRILKGELPLEVSDLEDEIAGLDLRVKKSEKDIKDLETQISRFKVAAKDCEALIARYEAQQNNVKNNREFEALGKEIEMQKLEIQLMTKRSKEAKATIDVKQQALESSKRVIEAKVKDLTVKQDELKEIISKTEKEETESMKKSERQSEIVKKMDERLFAAYHRIRTAYRNGLGVVTVERNACGGCFNQIPPQRQQEIRQRKKIIACEHCGRILVDDEITIMSGAAQEG